jgi:hypothetical protein
LTGRQPIRLADSGFRLSLRSSHARRRRRTLNLPRCDPRPACSDRRARGSQKAATDRLIVSPFRNVHIVCFPEGERTHSRSEGRVRSEATAPPAGVDFASRYPSRSQCAVRKVSPLSHGEGQGEGTARAPQPLEWGTESWNTSDDSGFSARPRLVFWLRHNDPRVPFG